MKYFTHKQIAVLLFAITTGTSSQIAVGGPTPRGSASPNAATGSGAASGGVNANTTTGNNTTTGTSTTDASGTATTSVGTATNSSGTVVGPSGTAVAPNGTTTGTGPGAYSRDNSTNGWTTNAQRYPVYRGTKTGPTIQSYSERPKEPPQIIGTVSGENGRAYYISDDGYMYSRDHDGRFRRFGRFQPRQPGDNLYGTAITPETIIPGTVAPADNTAVAPAVPDAAPAPPVASVPPPDAVAPSGAPNNDSDEARRRILEDEDRRRRVTTEEYDRQIRQRERERRESEEDDRNRFYITGKILSEDGKLLYIGSNGYVYYRGDDGHLHMVGGGIPQ